jgi:hypothetical protein
MDTKKEKNQVLRTWRSLCEIFQRELEALALLPETSATGTDKPLA